MRKIWINLFIAGAVLLTACSPSGGGGENKTQTQTPAAAATSAFPTQDPNASAMECQVVSIDPTPGPTEVSMFPPVTENDWSLGDAQSPVITIVEYSDFM